MAAYGAQIEQGKSEAEAVKYLEALFKNVKVQDKSARESLRRGVGQRRAARAVVRAAARRELDRDPRRAS